MKICSVHGCLCKQKSKGFCNKHYARWFRTGHVKATRKFYHNLDEAFKARTAVDEKTGCLLWTGTKVGKGYGQIWCNSKHVRAHRYVWEKRHGTIPKGVFVCHKCDTPNCVNVDHLFLGSHSDNMKDMLTKGRSAYGERSAVAKLKTRDIIKIRKLYKTGITQVAISKEYNIASRTVHRIVHHQTWMHIP